MRSCLLSLRNVVGLIQSLLLLGSCAGVLMGAPDPVTCIVWFLILCAVQVGILLLAVLAAGLEG